MYVVLDGHMSIHSLLYHTTEWNLSKLKVRLCIRYGIMLLNEESIAWKCANRTVSYVVLWVGLVAKRKP
jgi:hypothetical protein